MIDKNIRNILRTHPKNIFKLANRALFNKDLSYVKIYYEELKRLDSSHQDEQYQRLVSRMLEFAFENNDESFAIELLSEGITLTRVVTLDSKALQFIKIMDDPFLLASGLIKMLELYYESNNSPDTIWKMSIQTVISRLLEHDQDGTACRGFTAWFLSKHFERLSLDTEFVGMLGKCINFDRMTRDLLLSTKVKNIVEKSPAALSSFKTKILDLIEYSSILNFPPLNEIFNREWFKCIGSSSKLSNNNDIGHAALHVLLTRILIEGA